MSSTTPKLGLTKPATTDAATLLRTAIGANADILDEAVLTGDVRLLTTALQAALAGTSGTPGSANKFVTDADSRLGGATAADLQRLAYLGLQAGVFAAGDLMVTQRGAGANMSVDVATGYGVVASATTALLVPVAKTSTTNVTVTAAHATLPRIDQVVIDTTGAISVLAGTATSGATLDNRSGAASLTAGTLRLADLLVAAAATTVPNSSIRDRRPWARGFRRAAKAVTSGPTTTSTSFATLAEMTLRGEFSGAPVEVTFSGDFFHSVANNYIAVAVYVDGVLETDSVRSSTPPSTLYNQNVAVTHDITALAAGSHVIDIRWSTSAATATNYTTRRQMRVRESVTQDAKNNSTTSG